MTRAWQAGDHGVETLAYPADMAVVRCVDLSPRRAHDAGPRARIAVATLAGNDASRARGRRCCRDLLARMLRGIGMSADSNWQIGRLESGAPFLLIDGVRSPHHISFSHCHRAVAVGLSQAATIGVDVESIRPLPRMAEITQFLGWPVTTDESSHQRTGGTGEPAGFWTFWTLAEAYAKHRGGSLLADPHRDVVGLATRSETGKLFGNDKTTALSERISTTLVFSAVLDCSRSTGIAMMDTSPESAATW